MHCLHTLVEFRPISFRHDDIGHNKENLASMLREDLCRLLRTAGAQYRVPLCLKNALDEFSYPFFTQQSEWSQALQFPS